MEVFGIIGFVFGLSALAKIIMLEKQLKESGVLKEQAESWVTKWNASGSNQSSLMWLQNNYTVSLCGFIGVCIGYFTGHQEICIMIGVGIGILIRIVQSKSKWNASGSY